VGTLLDEGDSCAKPTKCEEFVHDETRVGGHLEGGEAGDSSGFHESKDQYERSIRGHQIRNSGDRRKCTCCLCILP